jgi:hypothetical protein
VRKEPLFRSKAAQKLLFHLARWRCNSLAGQADELTRLVGQFSLPAARVPALRALPN